ncbi:MAG: fibronectin type III domain-containing protein, partial [Desulfobacterales bacterium]|nr:fibronectin type III domain-containing protein [Desulfobacterales bacterium]
MNKQSTQHLILLLLLVLFYPALGWAMDVTLAWDPNTEQELAGYRIYAREAGEAYNYSHPEWEGTDTQCTVQGFDEYESYDFVVRAVDSEGFESGDSNEVYLPSDYDTGNSLDNGGGASDGGGGG